MAGEIKIPLPSFRKKMGRKRPFRFHSCAPLPSSPKDIQHGGQCSVGALWMAALLFSKTCPASTNSSVSHIPSTENQIFWKFSSNRWECSLWLPHSGSLDYPAGSSFQTKPKTPPENRSGAGKTHHSTSIPSSQRAPIRGCLFLTVMHHHRKHFRKRLQLFCQRLPTLLDWPLR